MFFEAEAMFQQLAQADPAYPLAVYKFGCFKLLTGAFKRKETMQLLRPFRDGSPAPDKTLMVHIEQGIGDAILYSC